MVVFSWKSFASSRIFSALMPQIAAAHSAVFAVPSLSPVR
jgi:hypothetical protein